MEIYIIYSLVAFIPFLFEFNKRNRILYIIFFLGNIVFVGILVPESYNMINKVVFSILWGVIIGVVLIVFGSFDRQRRLSRIKKMSKREREVILYEYEENSDD